MLNPPSLWITINPCDLHDPIAQVFAGEDINLDDLQEKAGPSKERRAENMALDPYAASKFFHFLIRTILTTLFGVEATTQRVHSRMGIFGEVTGYFGLVESQGRGTLHLHLLVWLRNTPISGEIEKLLGTEDFRQQIRNFIKQNIRAYMPGFESAEELKKIPNDVEVAYSRPPNPQSPDYDSEIMVLERKVARNKQHHTCEVRRCLVMNKAGRWVCKWRAPFQTADDDFVDEDGHWGMKRLYEFMNAWVPRITINARCNNDIKLLTNGRETTNISFYITAYSTKKQGRSYNMSAIMTKGFAYHAKQTTYTDKIRDQQRKLLFRLVHAINREQELSAPMVISYLMGWKDSYCSHRYTPIYWTSFVTAIFEAFPELRRRQGSNGFEKPSTGSR